MYIYLVLHVVSCSSNDCIHQLLYLQNKIMTSASFGLYLGNTSACLALYKDDNVDVVANHAGDRVTAAVIAFNDAETIIGAAAKAGLFRNGSNTILNNKRLMNKDISSEELDNAMKNNTTKIINESCNLQYSIRVNDKVDIFSPQKISSLLLRAMYEISTTAAHDDDEHNVVLCVPHRFNVESIKAWSDSAFNAGFKVLQVISEPIATCLAHGLGKNNKTSELVLVYRIGGVSSDITLVNVTSGAFSVFASRYYDELGGHKLTDLLTTYLGTEFRNKYKIDPTESRRSISKLKNEAEKCKHILSTMSTAHCFVESLCEGVDFSHNITRARFENLIASCISEYIQPIMSILQETSKTVLDIHKIIVCGGTMKIPKLQEKIASIFPNGEILTTRWSPDETMAVGAAMHSAHLIAHGMYDCALNSTYQELYSLAKTLCVKFDEIETIIIPEGTIVPNKIQRSIDVSTITADKISITVTEAECNGNEISKKIGLINLAVKSAEKLTIDIEITEVNLNVSITEVSTGKKSSFHFPIHEDDS